MPDIRFNSSNERSFKVKVGNTDICFLASDIISYEGTKYTGEAFYGKITNQRV